MEKICKCGHSESEHSHRSGIGCVCVIDNNSRPHWCPCDEFDEQITDDVLCSHCGHSINNHSVDLGCITLREIEDSKFASCSCVCSPQQIAIAAIDKARQELANDVLQTIYVKGGATR